MVKPAPKLDPRTANDIESQIQQLLVQYLPDTFRDASGKTKALIGSNRAVVKIFARLIEILIQRLNQVPDKNFLAFLDLLGASCLPPQPARVPLTFSLAAGSAVDAIVPPGTQVAAAQGELNPVIFETEQELVVTAAQLTSVWVRDPQGYQVGDYSAIAQPVLQPAVPAFEGNQAIVHSLYVGHDRWFSHASIQAVRLTFTLQAPISDTITNPRDPRQIQWEYWNGTQFVAIPSAIVQDNTQGLTQSNTVILGNETDLNTNVLPEFRPTSILGIKKRWLRCRLLTSISHSDTAGQGFVRKNQLPILTAIGIQPTIRQSGKLTTAFFNTQPIDLNKDFFPFGEKPKLGDSFYLASRSALTNQNATLTLTVNLSRTLTLNPNPQVTWEYWDGSRWQALPNSQDTTFAFTGTAPPVGETRPAGNPTGVVSFTVPADLAPTIVNGIEDYWLRARLTGGSYGLDVTYSPQTVPIGETNLTIYTFTPATFTPPQISSLTLTYSILPPSQHVLPPRPNINLNVNLPEAVIVENDGTLIDITTPLNGDRNGNQRKAIAPFQPNDADVPSLYLGFVLPTDRTALSNRPWSLYASLATVYYGDLITIADQNASRTASRTDLLQLVWQYWNGQGWANLLLEDQSLNFTRSGLIEFLPPVDFAPHRDFGLSDRYWLRVQWRSGTHAMKPRLRGLFLNTTLATQTQSLHDELLGSTNGNTGQTFRTTQSPVLSGQTLVVQELEKPSESERATLGTDAITEILDTTGQPQEIWVRWQEVTDFYASEPRDRHYVLNHLTGKIRFGDGVNGLIPPLGTGNLRLTYQTGGGNVGNKPMGTIVQLKTTIPYIDKVTNPEPATGGADAEPLDQMLDREPRKLRHNDRAVTLEDYEDLAMLASPAVARAKCIPLLNLLSQPTASPNGPDNTPRASGTVSVIVVPRSIDVQPRPSLELLNRVQDYLETHSLPTVTVAVVGPLYVQVRVSVEIALASLDGTTAVEQAVEQQLTSFLHPLTGGFNGSGWAFGREPYESDFYRLIESIPGVDYIRRLTIDNGRSQADPPAKQKITAILETKRFLVYSGKHDISLFFDDDR